MLHLDAFRGAHVALDGAIHNDVRNRHVAEHHGVFTQHQRAVAVALGGDVALDLAIDTQAAGKRDVALDVGFDADQGIDGVARFFVRALPECAEHVPTLRYVLLW